MQSNQHTHDLGATGTLGGHVSLDFINELDEPRFQAADPMDGYEMLTVWAREAGLLCPPALKHVRSESLEQRAEAEAVFARALALRQVLYNLFSAEAGGNEADPRDIAALNEELSAALCRRRLKRVQGRFRWSSRGSEIALDVMLWPIVYRAADLLASDQLLWVRECRGKDCRRLFLDASRGRNRRWCDMATCGNRAKARRNYARRRQLAA